MHTNGTTQSKPFKLGDVAAAHAMTKELPGKRPAIWGTALELCRKAMGWTQKQLIADGLPAENVGIADVKRWELARSHPTLNQCNKMRAAMPMLGNYDDLLKLELRADRRAQPKALREPVRLAGWPGPKVSSFAEALKWARVKHGMSQQDLSKLVGVVSIGNWERAGYTMIRGTYEKLLGILPELQFAPQPPFSAKYQNQFRAKGYLASEELRQETSRALKAVEPEPRVAALVDKFKGARMADPAPTNMAGAEYGVLLSDVMKLKGKKARREVEYVNEMLALDKEIDAAQEKADAAHARMMEAVGVMHGGAP